MIKLLTQSNAMKNPFHLSGGHLRPHGGEGWDEEAHVIIRQRGGEDFKRAWLPLIKMDKSVKAKADDPFDRAFKREL
jgi:hypothetical protein